MAFAFFGWVAFGRKRGPGKTISRMSFCIGTGLVNFTSVAGLIAVIFLLAQVDAIEIGRGLILIVPAMTGLASGVLALGRSQDAGKGRFSAAMTVIPVAGLFVVFAKPALNPARPPYRPRNRMLRFLIGFVALGIGSAVPLLVLPYGSQRHPRDETPPAVTTGSDYAALSATIPRLGSR